MKPMGFPFSGVVVSSSYLDATCQDSSILLLHVQSILSWQPAQTAPDLVHLRPLPTLFAQRRGVPVRAVYLRKSDPILTICSDLKKTEVF